MNTQSEALMQLADDYAEASFDQGLHKRTLDDAPENARSVLAAAVRSQHARIAELEAQLASIGAGGVSPLMGAAGDAEFMRQVVAVAVTMLFDGYKEDVMRVFSTGELIEIVRITAPLRPQQVEDIYKRAWDALSTPSNATGAAGDAQPLIARARDEWHEDDGPVTWWAWCGRDWAGEAPWCGTPLDSDWPGYHTHWTPCPPAPSSAKGVAHG